MKHPHPSGLVGDGHDSEPLLRAKDVARILSIPHKAVYALPIARVPLSARRIRWRLADVNEFISRRTKS